MLQKILVVDNEQEICEVCRGALGNLGYEVICAKEDQAIEIAKKENFELAIFNTLFDETTGVEIFEKIKQFRPTLAGILIADHASAGIVIDAMNKGFVRFCKKPLHEKQLQIAVNETIAITNLREDVTRMKILLPLYKLGQKFMAAESEQAIYEELVDAIAQEVQVPAVSLMMFDDVDNSLKVVAYRGLVADYVQNLQIKSGEQIAGKVFQSQRPMILNKEGQHLNPYLEYMNRQELSAAISFPIVCKGTVLGVLNVSESKAGMQFKEADIEMLSIIVDQAMMALENIRFVREREESSRVRTQLEQYVSPEVSNLLVQKKQDLLDVGRVEQLTVLFADIRNFTVLVQSLDPARLRLFLNNFFDMFTDIIFSYQGMLDKFMGDAALVIFGAPVKIDNPNIAAVSAAYQILSEFEKLRRLWQKEERIFEKIGLGIGISRGAMFLGNVGSSKRLDYTVIGQDVNIAQRLASVTHSGQILLTDRVYAGLNGNFSVKAENNMLLRGMVSEVVVYSLPVSDSKPE